MSQARTNVGTERAGAQDISVAMTACAWDGSYKHSKRNIILMVSLLHSDTMDAQYVRILHLLPAHCPIPSFSAAGYTAAGVCKAISRLTFAVLCSSNAPVHHSV